jgi:hypothetical protein
MASIERLYLLCNSDKTQNASYTALNYRMVNNSSLINIIPSSDFTEIDQITLMYQGDNNEKINYTYSNVDLEDVLNTRGDTLINKIIIFTDSFSDQVKKEVLSYPTSIGDTEEQKMVNTFVLGIANSLLMYYVSSKSVTPFANTNFTLPSNVSGIGDLNKNFSEYVTHFASTIASIPSLSVAKSWCKIHVNFWKHFSGMFIDGPTYNTHEAARTSILDFANHVNNDFREIIDQKEKLEMMTRNSIDTISSTSLKMSQEIGTLSETSLQSIQNLHDECINDFEQVRTEITSSKDEAIEKISEITLEYQVRLEKEYKILSSKLENQLNNCLHQIDDREDEFQSSCDQAKNEMCTTTSTVVTAPIDYDSIRMMVKNEVKDSAMSVSNTDVNLGGFFDDVNTMKTNYAKMKSKVDRLEGCIRDLTDIMNNMKILKK